MTCLYVKKSSFKNGMAVQTSVRRWKHTDRKMSVKGYKGSRVVYELFMKFLCGRWRHSIDVCASYRRKAELSHALPLSICLSLWKVHKLIIPNKCVHSTYVQTYYKQLPTVLERGYTHDVYMKREEAIVDTNSPCMSVRSGLLAAGGLGIGQFITTFSLLHKSFLENRYKADSLWIPHTKTRKQLS